jgi:hypothetical protein
VGTERFLQLRVTQKYLLGWLIFGGIIAILASVGGLTTVAESFADPRMLDRVSLNARDVFIGAWRSLAFVAIVDGIWYAYSRGKISVRNVGWALLLASAIDLWTIERSYWLFSPPAKQLYASDAIVEQIKAEKQPVRVIAFAVRGVRRDPFLGGDALMSHDIRTVWGYHGNQLGSGADEHQVFPDGYPRAAVRWQYDASQRACGQCLRRHDVSVPVQPTEPLRLGDSRRGEGARQPGARNDSEPAL